MRSFILKCNVLFLTRIQSHKGTLVNMATYINIYRGIVQRDLEMISSQRQEARQGSDNTIKKFKDIKDPQIGSLKSKSEAKRY